MSLLNTRVTAMFYVTDIHHRATHDPAEVNAEITLAAAFGGYLRGLPDDLANKDWSKYTPQGEMKMTVTNPGAIDAFEIGGVYQLEFTKVA